MKELALLPTRELREELNTAYNEAYSIARETETGNNLQRNGRSSLSGGIGYLVSVVGIFGFFIYMIANPKTFGINANAFNQGHIVLLAVCGIILLPLLLYLAKTLQKNSRANRTAVLSSDKKLAQLLEATVALPNIPVDYCNDLALGFMVERIDKGVATTWKDCVEQYEQQVHRWTMEKNSAEAAHYAKSAARSARWAAIGAWR